MFRSYEITPRLIAGLVPAIIHAVPCWVTGVDARHKVEHDGQVRVQLERATCGTPFDKLNPDLVRSR